MVKHTSSEWLNRTRVVRFSQGYAYAAGSGSVTTASTERPRCMRSHTPATNFLSLIRILLPFLCRTDWKVGERHGITRCIHHKKLTTVLLARFGNKVHVPFTETCSICKFADFFILSHRCLIAGVLMGFSESANFPLKRKLYRREKVEKGGI